MVLVKPSKYHPPGLPDKDIPYGYTSDMLYNLQALSMLYP